MDREITFEDRPRIENLGHATDVIGAGGVNLIDLHTGRDPGVHRTNGIIRADIGISEMVSSLDHS